MAPEHVENALEVPEYEIDPSGLDFTNSVDITKVMAHICAIFLVCAIMLYVIRKRCRSLCKHMIQNFSNRKSWHFGFDGKDHLNATTPYWS